jgi:hypothetical protein
MLCLRTVVVLVVVVHALEDALFVWELRKLRGQGPTAGEQTIRLQPSKTGHQGRDEVGWLELAALDLPLAQGAQGLYSHTALDASLTKSVPTRKIARVTEQA